MLWPNFCIDNFFQNPDSVLDFAKTLKFYKTNGTYPGERTKPLHEIDHDFFLNVTKKIVACLYPNDVKNIHIQQKVLFIKTWEEQNLLLLFICQTMSLILVFTKD